MVGFRGADSNRFTSNRVPLVSSTAGWLTCLNVQEHSSSARNYHNHQNRSTKASLLVLSAFLRQITVFAIATIRHLPSIGASSTAILSSYILSRMIRVAAACLSEPRGHFMDSALEIDVGWKPAVAPDVPGFPVWDSNLRTSRSALLGLPVLLVRHS